MSASYVETLSAELRAVGIRGRQARRITTEIADHLALDPDADLGSPHELARQFADELGTARARRAAVSGFGALALAAVAVAAAFVASRGAGVRWASVHPDSQALTDVAAAAVVLGGQVAFVAGLLAAVRAVRFRDRVVIPRAEARIVVRRTAVALGAGLVTMAGIALAALELREGVPGWVTTVVLAGAGVGAVGLVAVAPAALAAARVQPVARGPNGDLFDDLGPLVPTLLRGRPWPLAVCVAALVAVAIAAAGVVQADPYDGVLRGLADALACLAGFAVLGRYLGLQA